MNTIEIKLKEVNTDLFARLQETKTQIELLLQLYVKNFPTYTDHSLKHTTEVFKLVSDVLNEEEVSNLNDQELYCLAMASLLHDVGMCLPEEKIKEFETDKRFTHYKERNPSLTNEDLMRDLHHN
jgi:molecular chaperone HtpG